MEGTSQKGLKTSHDGLYYIDKIWTVSWQYNDKEKYIHWKIPKDFFPPKENELIVGQFKKKIEFDIYQNKGDKTNLRKVW